MSNPIEEIFLNISDQQEVVKTININLRPVLHGRKESDNEEEYFNKLSFCLGYHIKKVEILKSIVLTYFKHNVIRKGLDKNQVEANVEGIISSETGMSELIETARAFYDKALFKSHEQRDASFLMNCMKLIIESCLLVNFIEYVSNREHKSFLSYSYDELVEIFNEILEKCAGKALQDVITSM
jgi:hypothetical protein